MHHIACTACTGQLAGLLAICLCLLLAAPAAAQDRWAGYAQHQDPADYYGGFFPDEQWIEAALQIVPREQRTNPQLHAAIRDLSKSDLAALAREVSPFMNVEPGDLIGLVPRRTRLAGNARVMPNGQRLPPCPEPGCSAPLNWRPDRPDVLTCQRTGAVVDPFAIFPPTGVYRIRGPLGEVQAYPYHDDPAGRRTYVQAEYMDAQRVSTLAAAAEQLATLYHHTDDPAYAARAAAIVYDFALALPYWPKVARGEPHGFFGEERFRPREEYIVYASLWYDKYHSGLANGPEELARAYDLIVRAPVWDELNTRDESGDARGRVERDLFLESARDAIRYDIAFPHPEAALSNYIPYQSRAMLTIAAAAGLPELAHYALWKIDQMVDKTLMADGIFPESPSYMRQHVLHMTRGLEHARGYTDPPGFTSSISGTRLDNLDALQSLPRLLMAERALADLTFPDGSHITINDTHAGRPSYPPHDEVRSILFPAYGLGMLGHGSRSGHNRIQTALHFAGNWGHDHQDMLGLILWPYTGEMISDIGYPANYRMFATRSLGHNLVVVDRKNQGRVNEPGWITAWHPSRDGLQVIEVDAPFVYDAVQTYRRALLMLPVGGRHLVLDVFTVRGGGIHEWMAQGSGDFDQRLDLSIPMTFWGESYAADRQPFAMPILHADYIRERNRQGLPRTLAADEPDFWYGLFREVDAGAMAGPLTADFITAEPDQADVRLHLLAPTDARVFRASVPGLRRGAQTDASLADRIRMPKLVVRREGEQLASRFVAVWEPYLDHPRVGGIRTHASSDDWLAVDLDLDERGAQRLRLIYSTNPAGSARIGGATFRGRYAAHLVGADQERLWLYDATHYSDAEVRVDITARPALPLLEVRRLEEGLFALVLDGWWPELDMSEPIVERGMGFVALVDQGEQGRRAVPITGIRHEAEQTLLLCARHLGFTFDAAGQQLRDVFTPFRTVEGPARVSLPARVLLQRPRDDASSRWRVVSSTNPVTLEHQP